MVSQNLSGRITTEVRRIRTEELLVLRSGVLTGRKAIDTGILDLKHQWTTEMKMQIRARFPRGTGGPIPYRTGSMSGSFHRTLDHSPEGRIWLGVGNNKYAGFVNDFVPPIHWTNPASIYQWFTKAFRFMESIILQTLRRVIRAVGLAPMLGQSPGALATKVKPI
jgi:hypothetical protein